MNKSILAALIAAGLTFPVYAAQHEAGGHGKGSQAKFDKHDTNSDGKISREEFDAHRGSMFSKADADGNGALSAKEMERLHELRHAERRAAMHARMMSHLDTDGDGQVSQAELDAMAAKRFSRMDANGDGSLTPDEMRRGHHGGMGMGKGGMHKGGMMDKGEAP